ncbi:serine/threonine protein kinase [Niastella koreensis]|uniref:Serine/threonine protein kinase n=2 Tax=Niastella koreensis TaxID=354356 RepID=A0ABX3NSU3_9BACT|nr:ATP-binding SpoIIE family protein phosphatase [Niastella koreensis]AEV99334.1 putative anti-sigma regulatory factor, serine/threonine protein kinase [Niastella koreensis GR20-10]OQP45191.1 serine/threonine protein kinase [Niastella koreensis]
MVDNAHVLFKANDRSYFAILKKEIRALAHTLNFNERQIGEIDIIVAEMASNLVKHAGGGQILARLVRHNDNEGIELISIDNGAGINDVNKMVRDGESTGNTLGLGLGAMQRLSDTFQIYSVKSWGTIILCRKYVNGLTLHLKPPFAEIRSVVVPKPGETKCGDSFFHIENKNHIKLFLADGLGHGAEAARAVQEAGIAFANCQELDPPDILRYINLNVRKTRGLVGTVAIYDIAKKTWNLCGVGNISTKISGPTMSKNYMSYNGIIGLNLPRVMNSHQIVHEKGQYLIMCSDGLRSRWETLKYTGILRYDLTILAASLNKDFTRTTDDSSVAICKINT